MYVGVDIGGTHTRIGLFPSTDTPDFTLASHFSTAQSYIEQRDTIISELTAISQTTPLQGIGLSIGGRLARDGRSILVAPNLASYVGHPLAQELEDALSAPVRLGHDTVCGLLGEKKFGTLRSAVRCAYLTLSTGTGAAIHLASDLASASSPLSAGLTVSIEIGHQLLDGNDLLCLCGQVGCLETETGGRQLELRFGQSVDQITAPDFWERFCQKMSLGLINLVQLTRVEVIAIGGAIALHQRIVLPRLQQYVHDRLTGSTVTLLPATLHANAPLVGSIVLFTLPPDAILH